MSEKMLVAYFSKSGNSRKIADLIHNQVGGTIHEIQPQTPYPNSYNATVQQAKKEIQEGYKPPLKSTLGNINEFDMIFIGTPNWWSTIAPPVATFLSAYDLSGKTIVPFCTHGGGGLSSIADDITKLCIQSTILNSLSIYGDGNIHTQADVSAWLLKIGLLQ